MPFTLYSSDVLPHGFKYPAAFLELAESGAKFDVLYPWWFYDASSRAGELVSRFINEMGLIPFAKTDLYGDIACFVGNDTTGNPPIRMLCSSVDRSYGYASYQEWFDIATKDNQLHGCGT